LRKLRILPADDSGRHAGGNLSQSVFQVLLYYSVRHQIHQCVKINSPSSSRFLPSGTKSCIVAGGLERFRGVDCGAGPRSALQKNAYDIFLRALDMPQFKNHRSAWSARKRLIARQLSMRVKKPGQPCRINIQTEDHATPRSPVRSPDFTAL